MRITYLADGSLVAGESVTQDADNTPVIWLGETEVRNVTIDWSEIFSVITTTTATATNAAVSTSHSGTTQTLTVSAPRGYSGTITLTATDGTETHERQIVLHERRNRNRRDYVGSLIY